MTRWPVHRKIDAATYPINVLKIYLELLKQSGEKVVPEIAGTKK